MRVFFNANKNLFFFFCSDMFTKVKLNSSETKKRQKIVAWQQVALRCFVVALWTTNIYFWYLKPSEYYCDEGSGFNNLDLLATFPVYARCWKTIYSKFISLGPYSLFFFGHVIVKKDVFVWLVLYVVWLHSPSASSIVTSTYRISLSLFLFCF